jgi:glucose-6-phosphate isomerase
MGNFKKYLDWRCELSELDMSVDISRMTFSDADFLGFSRRFEKALDEMQSLEQGSIANADENRMVGHYWLRAPHLAPPDLRAPIERAIAQVKHFAAAIHAGHIKAPNGMKFSQLLVIGIGGSTLGPQFAADALGGEGDLMKIWFFDNTDPDGFDRVLFGLKNKLSETLVVVISKSGGTKETRNGMLEVRHAFDRQSLDFSKHAVSVTGQDSELFHASAPWLARFPMWDWVGGRTSELSAVGLLPSALQGFDIDEMLAGAKQIDECTRIRDFKKNPALQLAFAWHMGCAGRGAKDMVVLPYKDRLIFLSRYLQQLVMESLGKERNRKGEVVHQGLTVYGNKGSTDQHAYVQQLRDGSANYFALFVEVLKARTGNSIEVESGLTSGDYLHGFLQGTREALSENNRDSITLTLGEVTARTFGAVIALFERAVGFYASFIDVNAYHQPGVEAGKKGATNVLALQQKLMSRIRAGGVLSISHLANETASDAETVFRLVQHLKANSQTPEVFHFLME